MTYEHKMKYRLGIDLGTNSIGWCMLRLKEENDNLEPISIIKMGVRIFHDGRNEKDKTPLAVARREARGIRRNLDRRKARQKALLKYLTLFGMFPTDEKERKSLIVINPYEIRSCAVEGKIPLYYLGRICMHLSKHRGFKSNRKQAASEDSGKIKPAVLKLREILEESKFQTAGQYLYSLLKENKPVRTRLHNNQYDFYLERSMLEHEFDIIMQKQQEFYKDLTDDKIKVIKEILFKQRPLKPQVVGKCTINKDEDRILRAHSISQKYIMLQKINDLRVFDNSIKNDRKLTSDEKNIIKGILSKKEKMTFDALRKTLKKYFPETEYDRFSIESVANDIQGNKTNAVMSNKKCFGEKWYSFSDEEQYNIIEHLFSNDDDSKVEEMLKSYGLDNDTIENIMVSINKLPAGYLNYGKTAVFNLANIMDSKNIDLYDAKTEAGYSEKEESKVYDNLVYYGQILEESVTRSQSSIDKIEDEQTDEDKYGKIANPTVHIALNQLRKLINELIELYGKPSQIVIELARDLKNSREAKNKIAAENKKNKEENKKIDELIDNICNDHKVTIPKTAVNRNKARMWREQNEMCIYTGKKISLSELFTNEVQIEHILPFSQTLDDSRANKVLSTRASNYYKGNRTPYEAFHENKDGYNYHDIITRVSETCPYKLKRFTDDAMEMFKKDGDFIARQLTDTQYLSRIALKYLKSLYTEDEGRKNIWSIPGRLTAMIRGKLGLNNLLSDDNEKNREDHRHHAVDAFVVSITTRSFLQKISTASAKTYNNNQCDKLLENMPKPYNNYLKDIEEKVINIKVSHKINRGLEGRLHEDTYYGIVKDNDKYNLVRRQPVDLKNSKNCELIRDKELRDMALLNQEKFEKVVIERNIRHLRMLKKDNPIIEIKDKNNETYKAVVGGDNLCVEIYRKSNGKIDYEVIERFHANQKGFKPKWIDNEKDAVLLMRLFKGDIIGFIRKDKTIQKDTRRYCYYVVTSIKANGQVYYKPINYSNKIMETSTVCGKLIDRLKAKQFNISVSGIVSRSKKPDINYWNKK